MGRKSTKDNKTIYQQSRESLGYTRQQAAELLQFISIDRIEKIEYEKTLPHPEEVLMMSECYKNAVLCNYFCSHECPIGIKYIPKIQSKELSQITLEVLSALNKLAHAKDQLIEITLDGNISNEELSNFLAIKAEFDKMVSTINSLNLWLEQKITDGKLNNNNSID